MSLSRRALFLFTLLFFSLFFVNVFGQNDPTKWERLPSDSEINKALQLLNSELSGNLAVNGEVVDSFTVNCSPVVKFHNKNEVGKREPQDISRALVFVEESNFTGSKLSEYNLIQSIQDGKFVFVKLYQGTQQGNLNDQYTNFINHLNLDNNDSGLAIGFAPFNLTDPEDSEESEDKEKGTVWELVSTDVSLDGNPGELGNTNPFGDARIKSSGTWSQPPQFLYAGETESLRFWLEDDSIHRFIEGTKHSSKNIATNVQIEDLDWEVPSGNVGDRLALTFAVKGPDNVSDAGTVVFFYEFKSYNKTPKVGKTKIDKEKTDDLITDDSIIEDMLDQLTGMGGVGSIPGPENIKQALAGVVVPAILIAILTAFGQSAGSAPATGTNGGTPVPPDEPQGMTLTDALGRKHEYDWSPEDGGYINPETGGMLDSSLWKEYNKELATNQEFNARQREKLAQRDTDFDRQVDKLLDSQKQHKVLIKELDDLRKTGYRLGPDGVRASGHAQKLLEQARHGQPVSSKQVAAVKRFIHDRQSGRTEVESDRQSVSELDVVKEGVQGTVRTAFTAKNPDGTTNWVAMGTRIGVAIKTLGGSEFVMIPAESGYVVKDCMDQGATVGEAVATAGAIAVVSAVAGKMIAGGLGVVAKGAGWIARGAAKGAGKYLPGTSAAVKQAAKWFGKGVSGVGKQFKQIGKLAKDGVRTATNKLGVGGSRAVAKQSTRSVLTQAQKKIKQTFTKAVAEGDEQALMGLYKNGGMKKLAALEKAGHMTPTQVKAASTIMNRNMKVAIKEGTEESVERFERETSVKIKEVLLGDSGSSAKGTARSILTDYDRTNVVSFDDKALASYIKKHAGSIDDDVVETYIKDHHDDALAGYIKKHASSIDDDVVWTYIKDHHAVDSIRAREILAAKEFTKNYRAVDPIRAREILTEQNLVKKFMKTQAYETRHSVRRKLGLNASKDLDFATYNGIGSSAGPSDSYPLGYTNARQSIIGTGTRTYRDANGKLSTHVVSGDTIVDTNNLRSARMAGELAPDPTHIVEHEMPDLLNQQVEAAKKYHDVKSLAKATGRANYVAQRAKLKTDPELSRLAKQIFDNPQKMKTILQQNGVSEAQFVKRTRQLINNLAGQLG